MSKCIFTEDNGKDHCSHTVEHWLTKILDGRELDGDTMEWASF